MMSAVMIFLAGVSWSFAGVLSKYSSWSALTLGGARAIIAVIILGIARKSFKVKLTKGVVLGALGAASTSVLFMMANKLTTAANAIVLQYAMPVFVMLYSVIIMKEKLRLADLITMLAVIAGVILCFVEGFGAGGLLGDLLSLTSALTYTLVFLAARYFKCNPFDYAYLGNLLVAPLFLFAPFDAGFTLTGVQVPVALVMGLCLGFGYLFFSIGMKSGISPITASLIANAEPVLNPTWAFIILGENPGTLAIIGAALVLCAVTVNSVYQYRKQGRAVK